MTSTQAASVVALTVSVTASLAAPRVVSVVGRGRGRRPDRAALDCFLLLCVGKMLRPPNRGGHGALLSSAAGFLVP